MKNTASYSSGNQGSISDKSQKVWYWTASTMNGYIADENDSLDWLFECTNSVSDPLSFQGTIGVIVCGSHTFEWILTQYDVLNNPKQWQAFFGDIPMVVFSSRILTLPEMANITIINSTVPETLPLLKHLAGNKDIWIQGGGDLAGQFFEAEALTHIGINYIATATIGGVNVIPRRIPLHNLYLTRCDYNQQSWLCEFTLVYPTHLGETKPTP